MTTSDIRALEGTKELAALLDCGVHSLPFTLVETNSESDSYGNTYEVEYIIQHDDGRYFRLTSPSDSYGYQSGTTLHDVDQVFPKTITTIIFEKE